MKNKTKSILTCAVLASVLAGGAVAQAAMSATDEAAIGYNLQFGNSRYFFETEFQTIGQRTAPTWQIAKVDDGLILFAKESWGRTSFTTYGSGGKTCRELYYEKFIGPLNDWVDNPSKDPLFTTDEKRFLKQLPSTVKRYNKEADPRTVADTYDGVFALPTPDQLEGLGKQKVRTNPYWIYDSEIGNGHSFSRGTGLHLYPFFIGRYVETDGSVSETDSKSWWEYHEVYPVIKIDTPLFLRNANYNKNVFKSYVAGDDTLKPVYMDLFNENKVNIKELEISTDKINVLGSKLKTGAGQGMAGALEWHYRGGNGIVSYAYFGDSSETGECRGTIQFGESDPSGYLAIATTNLPAGDYTIHLFNQGNMGSIDYAGGYTDLNIELAKNGHDYNITKFKTSWDMAYDKLIINKGVEFSGDNTSNLKINKQFGWYSSNGNELVRINNIKDGGWVNLAGAFYVENPNGYMMADRVLRLTTGNMDLSGVNDGTMTMSLDLCKLHLGNGTIFTVGGNLIAHDEVLLDGASVLTVKGKLDVAGNLKVTGTLKLEKGGTVNGNTYLYGDSALNFTTGIGQLELKKSLTASNGVTVEGANYSDKVKIDENLIVYDGNVTFKNVDVEVGNNMEVKGDINASNLIVKNYLDLANGNEQSGTIGILTLGEKGKTFGYAFDVGKDKFAITNSASGKVKLVPKYGIALSDGGMVEVFTGSGNLNNLILADARVTDMANKKTYLLTQDATNKGQLKVTLAKHNAAVNYNDTDGSKPLDKTEIANVLFVTNKDEGKGSVAVGNMTKLKDVDSSSKVELTYDDAYIAEKTGTARKTGDVRVGVRKLAVGKDSIKTDYYTTYKDNNSYLSLFIGDAALPQDIFGYGKLAQVAQSGNGDLTLNLNDFTANFTSDECRDGFDLSFVNEYGSGSSRVGDFYDYGKMYVQDGKVTLDLPVRNLPRYDLSVSKGSKLIIRGETGKEDIISGDSRYLQIKGDGTVAFDKVVFSNKNLSEGMDVEVNDATLRVEIDNRYENGAIVLKTDGLVSLNSVKVMEGTTGKLFFDVARMGTGFSDSMWAFDTSKTLKCLDAITNDVTFDFGDGYVIVGSKDMYEFANGSKGEVTVTRKKVGNGDGNSGEAAFSLGWFQELKDNNIYTVNFGEDMIISSETHVFGQGEMKEFTVNGNGHKLIGDGDAKGLQIYSGSTFTLKNISEISGFKDFAFRNGGKLNIIGETLLRGNILNYEEVPPVLKAAPVLMATPGMQEVIGTTNIDGSLIVDTPIIIENDLKFEDNGALKVFGTALNEGPAISGVNSLTVGENVALQFDPNGIRSLNSEYPVIDCNVDPDEMNKFQFDKGSIENIGTVFDANFTEGKIVVNWNPDMANFGENLGVSRGAYDVADMVETAVWNRAQDTKKDTLWATYIHNRDKVDGMGLGFGTDAKYSAQYNGTIVGYDFSNNAGVALSYVDGNTTNGYGGHNDGKHYGVSFYGQKQLGKAVLSGDFSYLHGKNELTQNINWEHISADADTNTYELSVHLEQTFNAGNGEITPFAGLRYMRLNGKDYRNNLGVSYDADNANIFTGTLGVNYNITLEDERSGWQITPNIEAGYAFNFGDRNNDMTVGYKTAKDKFGYDVTDKGYVFLQGGLNFTKKNLTMGVGYDFTKGSNSHNNRWNVNLNYAF